MSELAEALKKRTMKFALDLAGIHRRGQNVEFEGAPAANRGVARAGRDHVRIVWHGTRESAPSEEAEGVAASRIILELPNPQFQLLDYQITRLSISPALHRSRRV